MPRQAEIVKNTEGDAWYLRNKEHLGEHDPVSDVIADMGITPKRVMEVGCSDGWRLSALRSKYGCQVVGIEPGFIAQWQAKKTMAAGGNGIDRTYRRTAEDLPRTLTGWADVLIYGFCLYLTDPEDWFRIAMEGDRVLSSNGIIIIHDFFHTGDVFCRDYKHYDRMVSYHYDFAKLWLGHPLYSLHRRHICPDGEESVTVLRKRPDIEIG